MGIKQLNGAIVKVLAMSSYIGPRAMVGEACSRKGTFRPEEFCLFVRIAPGLPKFQKFCPDF